MSYIGSTPTTQSFIAGTDYFNGTGSTTAFTLSRSVVSVNDIQATVNNVVQVPNDAYTVSGTTITFTSAPSAGTNNVYVRYLSTTTQSITPSQNTVSYSTLNSDNQSKLGISFKNRIINGAMVIDQRNAGASISAAGGGKYAVDRWRLDCDNIGTATIQQSSTAPTGFVNSWYFNSTVASSTPSAGNDNSLFQNIEGYNIADLGWGTANAKTVTVSFWVQSTVTGTYGFGIINASVNRSYVGQFTISAANTWTQVSVTIPGDTTGTWGTTNGTGIRLAINMGAGSNQAGTANAWQSGYKYFATGNVSLVNQVCSLYLTGVQLEVGTQATTFDYRSYGTELALCQRYFVQTQSSAQSCALGAGTTSGAGGNGCLVYIPLSPSMRAVPTGTISGVGWTDNATYTATASSINSIAGSYNAIRLYLSGSGGSTTNGAAVLMVTTATSGGYLALSSEL